MKSKLNIRLLLVCAMVALMGLSAACTRESDGDGGGGTPLEVTHDTIRADVRVNIDASLGGMARAMTFVNESDLMELVPVGVEDDCFDEFGDSCGGDGDLNVDFEDQSDEMAQWLEENVFIDANVEDEAGTTVTYLLPASLFCGGEARSGGIAPDPDFDREGAIPEGPGDVPDEIDEDGGDAECERMFTEVPVRLKVTSRRSGDLDLAILVGEGRLSPVSIRIYRNEFAIALDLGQLKSSAELFANASDEELDLPSVMKGKIEAVVRASGNTFEAEFSILETIEVLSMSMENPMSIRIGAARPALKAVVNGDARTATLLADFGTLDLMASGGLLGGSSSTFCYSDGNGQEICEEEEGGGSPFGDGPIALHLGGLSATTTFDGNTESLTITNLGLGNDSTTVAVDGQEIISVDLNPNNGRRADVTISASEESMEVQFAPAFDLVLGLAMRHLENSEEMPEWAQDENLRVTFDGSSKPTLRSGEGGLQVIEGSLKLTSNTYGVTTINAGQCIIAEDQGGFDDGPIGDQPGDEWEDEGPTHPFEGIEGGSCQQ